MGHYDEFYEAAEAARRDRAEAYAKVHGWGCKKHKDYKGRVVPTNECNDCWTIFIKVRLGKNL